MARHTMQQLSVFALDSTTYLGQIESLTIDAEITTEDGGTAAASDEFAVEVKRAFTGSFTLNVNNGSGARMTAAQIATMTAGGDSQIGITKSFNIAMSGQTQDGSGIGNLDSLPILTRRDITIDTQVLVPIDVRVPELLAAAVSSTPADRQMDISVNFGDKTLTGPFTLTRASLSQAKAQLDTVSATFRKRGALVAPSSGTDIYMVAFAGDGLLSFAATIDSYTTLGVANGDMEIECEACITGLTVQIEDGQIVKANGNLAFQIVSITENTPD